jgi:methylmalonyl-CoA mutase N-terminal domain/subunit
VEERQKARLARLREKRDNEKVNAALTALEDACEKGMNVVPYTLQCARVGCSEGEMFKVFKKAFGPWKPPVFW